MPLYDFVKKYNTITIFYSLIVWCFIPYPQYSTPFNGGKHNVTTICNRHCHRSGDYIYWLCWWPWPLISTGCCSCSQPVTDGGGELPLAWPASEGHPLDGRCPHGIPVSHSARTGVSVQVRCIDYMLQLLNSLFWVSRDILMDGDEFTCYPNENCSIRNLYQGFRKSHDKLLLTNNVVSSDVGQFPCRYRWHCSTGWVHINSIADLSPSFSPSLSLSLSVRVFLSSFYTALLSLWS